MPQRTARQRWIAIALSLFALAEVLSACSVAELKSAVVSDKAKAPTASPLASYIRPGEPEILVADEPIIGGKQELSGMVGEFARILVGTANTITLMNPVAVGGVNDQLFIVDAGARAIYRYNLTTKAIQSVGQAGGQFMGEPSGIHVESDLSFYVADPSGKQVLYFDQHGNFIRRYSDLANLARPVDVVSDEALGNVYVADGTYSHIVVFSKSGQALSAIGARGRGPGKFRTITAMARNRGSLFVADRLELPLQELDFLNGSFRNSFGQGQLVWPTSIVVDKRNRIFVSDRSDNTIKVFDDNRLIATIGGTGSAPGRFRLVTDMWLSDQNLLYVADSLNRRVQVFRLLSEDRSSGASSGP